MPKELDEIGFPLCNAIQNGIKNNPGYPVRNGALSIQCVDNIKEFQAFATIFSELCERHKIPSLPDAETYSIWNDSLSVLGQPQCKFIFNISPDDFDKLLMVESDAYQGYRNSNGAGSILLLADPSRDAYKKDVICAFPVLLLDNNTIMIRNAGCNASATLSTQLTYLITQYLPAETYNNLNSRYGHWGSKLTNCIMDELHEQSLVEIAINCVGKANKSFYIQSMEGFDSLHLHERCKMWLQEMNPEAENIYSLLGVASPDELANLKSLEIPSDIFLQALHDYIKICLKDYELGGERVPGGKYYYPDNEKYDRLHCEKLQSNLINLDIILRKIKDIQHTESASSQNAFSFFQAKAGASPSTDLANANSIKFSNVI
jgi:hypothetical protein